VGRVETTYHYEIRNGRLYQSDKDGTYSVKLSRITGPLAWCFNLGSGPSNKTSGNYSYSDQKLAQMIGDKNPWFVRPDAESLTDEMGILKEGMPWLTCIDATDTTAVIGQVTRRLEPYEDWVADYYYSYQWDEDFKNTLNQTDEIPETDSFRIPEEAGGSDPYIYLRGEEAADNFIAGDEVSFGNINDDFAEGYPNYGKITIDTIATDSGYTKIEATDDKIYKGAGTSPFSPW
jgi:hypothetical protein